MTARFVTAAIILAMLAAVAAPRGAAAALCVAKRTKLIALRDTCKRNETSLDALQANAGDKGDKGDPGAMGAAGAQGPEGPQGPPGLGGAAGITYSEFLAGPVSVPISGTFPAQGLKTLTIEQPGKYVLVAKAWFDNTLTGGGNDAVVDCRLLAKNESDSLTDSDLSSMRIEHPTQSDPNHATIAALPFNLVHQFPAPSMAGLSAGSAILACKADAGVVKAHDIRITAVRVGD